jgi:hypothetical protein
VVADSIHHASHHAQPAHTRGNSTKAKGMERKQHQGEGADSRRNERRERKQHKGKEFRV